MVVAAAGCSLVAMVARICASSPKYSGVHEAARRLVADADGLREQTMVLRAQDERAYAAVVAARGDKAAMQRALHAAASVPLEGARAALRVLELAAVALSLQNANLISDVGCAAEFGYAALEACAYNVRINHKFMKDEDAIRTQSAELDELRRKAAEALKSLRDSVNASLS
jgi:formiminotetrahydrofolate cyclodeaminase